jgi:pantetheine-phosphate adenylyltransferase
MTGFRWIFTSSSIIKEAAQFGGDISEMVPEPVKLKLMEKFPPLKNTLQQSGFKKRTPKIKKA